MAPPFTQPHVESSPKRVRVLFGGTYIVDTTNAKLVWEHQYFPIYYFSSSDLSKQFLQQPSSSSTTKTNADEKVYDLVVGSKRAESAVTEFTEGELKGLVRVKFSVAEAWFEEDEEIYNHPKDPYKRVDVLASSRHIRIEYDGVELANTRRPRLLFETGFRVRTYIPKVDCKVELFENSDLTTQCPYKGIANYYSVRLPSGSLAENIIWWYRTPQLECAEVKGCVAFYDEKVDVWVDGVKVERPQTMLA
ncbi:hypothetical protein JAAARDRAFT_34040 [Jaapia argillacea MUCL 33604]|uniref:DUF427 domain-containing protein n=1 Tax=Jaapia argillacea MUCL 33604 TaxID=933084 RepID=A0A067PX47_9AGAM|nr:hypothetical protein JAAARDRAFT_34040 [Jaapia argillacea MUCL 33604]